MQGWQAGVASCYKVKCCDCPSSPSWFAQPRPGEGTGWCHDAAADQCLTGPLSVGSDEAHPVASVRLNIEHLPACKQVRHPAVNETVARLWHVSMCLQLLCMQLRMLDCSCCLALAAQHKQSALGCVLSPSPCIPGRAGSRFRCRRSRSPVEYRRPSAAMKQSSITACEHHI